MTYVTNAKISALLITLNEERNIDGVLESLNFADEIILVDSYSTDGTVQRAQRYPKVKVIQREFKNYTDQKAFALEQATYDWVLFIDADERIPCALKSEILQVTNATHETASAYYFSRTFMFQDKVVRFSGTQNDKNYRLFKKSRVHFAKDRIVHETLVVDGASKTLKNKLLHYSYSNYNDYKQKAVKYGKMKAYEKYKKGKKARWYHLLFWPLFRFFSHYIIRLGFLDGKKGMILCYISALGVYTRFKELRRLGT